ncbi:MAG: nucleotidyltransferase domain-containing protein [Candidatus Hydrogenedentes bacterium]|nr:nucleotidyltransferase domain-containing protein [Candidatus Hydrogenedentota bacterium]MBI3117863.1 nucleotidyltransferase domain-containing protein [Candidatus Hydrogenedentota bacterium]
MQATIQMKPEHLALATQLLADYAPDAEVWAYGSRVTGDAHAASDLDLVLRNPRDISCPQPRLLKLRAAFADSTLPIIVEVHDWATIPENLRNEIERAYVVLRKPPVA